MTAADQIVRSAKKTLAIGGRPHMACNLDCRHDARSANHRRAASSHICGRLGIPQESSSQAAGIRGFPADRLDAGNPLQLAIEPLTDGLGAKPPGVNVARRGNKEVKYLLVPENGLAGLWRWASIVQ